MGPVIILRAQTGRKWRDGVVRLTGRGARRGASSADHRPVLPVPEQSRCWGTRGNQDPPWVSFRESSSIQET